MSSTFAYIALTCTAVLFLSLIPFPFESKMPWLNGPALFSLRSVLLAASLVAALLGVVFMFLN
jgi:hypothetical protein